MALKGHDYQSWNGEVQNKTADAGVVGLANDFEVSGQISHANDQKNWHGDAENIGHDNFCGEVLLGRGGRAKAKKTGGH